MINAVKYKGVAAGKLISERVSLGPDVLQKNQEVHDIFGCTQRLRECSC
jgi:hypothetical protein